MRNAKVKKRSYFKTVPGALRTYITLVQLGGFVSMMALFNNQCYVHRCRGEIVDLRISYLVFSSIGCALSGLFLILGKCEKLPPRYIMVFTDFCWIMSGVVLSVFCAVYESKYGDRFFLNMGALAVSAAFGLIAVILYTADAMYYLRFDYDEVPSQ